MLLYREMTTVSISWNLFYPPEEEGRVSDEMQDRIEDLLKEYFLTDADGEILYEGDTPVLDDDKWDEVMRNAQGRVDLRWDNFNEKHDIEFTSVDDNDFIVMAMLALYPRALTEVPKGYQDLWNLMRIANPPTLDPILNLALENVPDPITVVPVKEEKKKESVEDMEKEIERLREQKNVQEEILKLQLKIEKKLAKDDLKKIVKALRETKSSLIRKFRDLRALKRGISNKRKKLGRVGLKSKKGKDLIKKIKSDKRKLSRRSQQMKRLKEKEEDQKRKHEEIKEIYDKIKLKKRKYKELSTFTCYDYHIPEGSSCVPAFFSQQSKLGKRRISSILKYLKIFNNAPTYRELTMILNDHDISLDVYTCDRYLLQEQVKYRFHYRICVHDGHMYVIKSLAPKITNEIFLEEDEYRAMFEEAKKNVALFEYTNFSFVIDRTKYIRKQRFTNIEKKMKLLGLYSDINEEFAMRSGLVPFRYNMKDLPTLAKLDFDNSYSNIAMNYKLPVNTGTEQVYEYSGAAIRDCYFYRVRSDNKLFEEVLYGKGPHWMIGYELKSLMKLLDCTPLHYIRTTNTNSPPGMLSANDLSLEYDVHSFSTGKKIEKVKLCKTKEVLERRIHKEVRNYTGFLARTLTDKESRYGVTGKKEREGLRLLHGDEFSIGLDEVVVSKSNYKGKSGCFPYMGIVSIARSQIIDLYVYILKHYPQAKITRLMTDSIGLDIKLDLSIFEEVRKGHYRIPGCKLSSFKEEELVEDTRVYLRTPNAFNHLRYMHKKVNEITIYSKGVKGGPPLPDLSKIRGLIKEKKSMIINDFAGAGKSYWVKNTLIKDIFEKEDVTHICTSSILLNAKEWNDKGLSIGHYTKKSRGIRGVVEELKGYDYIIVDEASQLTMRSIHILERLGRKFSIILIGDDNQCPSSDGVMYLTYQVILRICGYNRVRIGYHENIRYPKEYYDFLTEFVKKGKKRRLRSAIGIVKRRIRKATEKERKENRALSYTHKIRQHHDSRYGLDRCKTIHSYQGMTIKKKYVVYINSINDYRILYTALSRTSLGFEGLAWYKVPMSGPTIAE